VRHQHDQYFTIDGLARTLVDLLPIESHETVLEPTVGDGAFAKAVAPKLDDGRLIVNDIDQEVDGMYRPYLGPAEIERYSYNFMKWQIPGVDWTIGNPPYGTIHGRAEDFVRHAYSMSNNVAFLMRLGLLASKRRGRTFWPNVRLRKVWVLVSRPSFTGDGRTDSSEYGWYWFDKNYEGKPQIDWIDWKA